MIIGLLTQGLSSRKMSPVSYNLYSATHRLGGASLLLSRYEQPEWFFTWKKVILNDCDKSLLGKSRTIVYFHRRSLKENLREPILWLGSGCDYKRITFHSKVKEMETIYNKL
ncbi:hypothetical protein Zmor_009573 [Zophobas morio]|uniref:Uncharacterized protein n=1 Tax=Zophobas morio TaxID=2755281 RepID=A0AA38IH35_9CUCU|nr:hypothetical protein Zmor_009573 [Zophobas morio]